jgi:hypothetical protein
MASRLSAASGPPKTGANASATPQTATSLHLIVGMYGGLAMWLRGVLIDWPAQHVRAARARSAHGLDVHDHRRLRGVLPPGAERQLAAVARVSDRRHALSLVDVEAQHFGSGDRVRQALRELGNLRAELL